MEEEVLSGEDCVEEEKCSLAKYATQSKEALVKTATAELNLEIHCQCEQERKEKKPIERAERKSATWTICEGNRMPQ